jgi:hypothetical protein
METMNEGADLMENSANAGSTNGEGSRVET